MPGQDNMSAPLSNTLICLQFVIIDIADSVEYQEVVTTTTDRFGMVNLVIGTHRQNGGFVDSFNEILWDGTDKYLKIEIDVKGSCSQFEEISNQRFNYVPMALNARTAENVTGTVAIENGGTGSNTIIGTKTNLELELVDNTADTDKPVSTATQTAIDLKANIASPTFTGTVGGIDKTMVGLPNVDNTTDALKPVSTATQTALDAKAAISGQVFTGAISATNLSGTNTGDQDLSSFVTNTNLALKANLASPTFTGTPALPTGTVAVTQTAGDNSTAIATTAYVDGATNAINTLVDGKIYLGNASNKATQVALSGDVTIDNAGVSSIGADKVVTEMIADANITNNKLDKANIPLSGFGAATVDVALGANKLTGVADPTEEQDAATKKYVDVLGTRLTTLEPINLKIGDAYEGGIIFYLDASGSRGLIAATEDQVSAEWGCRTTTITGADGTAIGTGSQNTIDIIAGCNTIGTPAYIAANYTNTETGTGVYSDWFLPSKDELNLMYLNIGQGNALGLGNIGNFASGPYWSSSESSINNAWYQGTWAVGEQYPIDKGSAYKSRAVRAFTLSGSTKSVGSNASAINANTRAIEDVVSLPQGTLYLGNSNGVAKKVALTGDVTINNAGVSSIGVDKVVTNKLKDANVTYAKIQNVASGKILGRTSSTAGVVEEIATSGTGTVVLATSPTLITPALGTPSELVGINITGTAASFTAGKVTTNANLTGPITSLGNATSVASQTGTGSTFVMNTSPTLVTPVLGVATAASINGSAIPTSKTLVVTTDKLNTLSATSSAELAEVISDETGTGKLVLSASPSLTGTPIAPTASAGTNNTQVATTGFVINAVSTATTDKFVDLTTDQTIAGTKNFNGNIGIGTTAPKEKLHISGEDSDIDLTTYGTDVSTIDFDRAGGTKAAPTVLDDSARLGFIHFNSWSGTEFESAASIYGYTDGAQVAGSTPGRLYFSTTHTNGRREDAMRIDSDGEVRMYYNLVVEGSVRGASVITTSDKRLKTNIQPIDGALETLKQLAPYSYSKKSDLKSATYNTKEFGFLAQDIQKSLPFLVKEGADDDQLLSLDYNSFIALLVKGMQEQAQEIINIKKEHQDEIASIKKEIEAIKKALK